MNLRPTLLKIIISLIAGLFLGFYIVVEYYPNPGIGYYLSRVILGIIFAIVIYLIWSLIQKK
jgi:hypothetical protein